jgi:hypothetical protein
MLLTVPRSEFQKPPRYTDQNFSFYWSAIGALDTSSYRQAIRQFSGQQAAKQSARLGFPLAFPLAFPFAQPRTAVHAAPAFSLLLKPEAALPGFTKRPVQERVS